MVLTDFPSMPRVALGVLDFGTRYLSRAVCWLYPDVFASQNTSLKPKQPKAQNLKPKAQNLKA